MTDLTVKELRKALHYNPCTGEFTWRRKRKGVVQGSRAGTFGKDGYRIIMLNSQNYYAHRLAWFYVHGTWPEEDLDHIDTVRSNVCFFNLRAANRSQNMQNGSLRTDNKSGHKGVSYHSSTGMWRATIKINKKQKHLGLFHSVIQAAEAYNTAAKELFGAFANIKEIPNVE